MLIVCTVLAVACAVIPSIWVARAGVLVALVMAWVSVLMAWREVENLRISHLAEMKAIRQASMAEEQRHHKESMEMIDTFANRVGVLAKTISDTRGKLDRAENELSTLRGDKAALQYKVAAGNKKVNALESRVAELETELAGVLADAEAGRLADIPGRTVADAGVPNAEDIWDFGNAPTVVDLSRVTFPDVDALDQRKHA
ncbi:cell division topological specificity factor MinE [Acidipropionibacterium thoenii]|uniref:cell division topological specificity factor MinE n=1 Tax=Acidipropionibacterium thoenii TaxID=1751 RepID=UPI0004128E99|nr:cell division topological specificity factor MinE [Acidipropionibacterium thoenii]